MTLCSKPACFTSRLRALIVLALVAGAASLSRPSWAAYTGSRLVDIDHTQVSGATGTLTDFPVLIRLRDHELKFTGSGGKVTSAQGDDITFQGLDPVTCGGPAPCNLDHELQAYDSTTGSVTAWVRLPALSKSADTTILLRFGDPTIGAPTEDPVNVWSARHAGVWHLDEDPTGAPPQHNDETVNNNDGTAVNSPAATAGQIANALAFDDTNERHVNVPDTVDLRFANDVTVAAWVTTTDTDAFAAVIANKWQGVGSKNYWLGKVDASSVIFQLDDSAVVASASLALINDGGWHHVVGVADSSGGGDVRIYVDGVLRGNDPSYTGVTQTGTSPFQIGKSADIITQTWLGDIDEVYVSGEAHTGDWIATAYTNQNAIAPFFHPLTHYRSIGARPNYGTGEAEGGGTTVSATNGSRSVTGAGTAWKSSNRGRGDRVTIDGGDYTVLFVVSETELLLTAPFVGATGVGKPYAIARKFTTIATWETCVDGTVVCQGVGSANLVADNRAEVGIVYDDGSQPGGIVIDGSATGPSHTITLTADPGNRHLGLRTQGAIIDNGVNPADSVSIRDDHVIFEWLRVTSGGGGSDGIQVINQSAANQITLQNLMVYETDSSGIVIEHVNTNANIFNNIVHDCGARGIRIAVNPTSTINVFNNTVYSNDFRGINGSAAGTYGNVTLRNNIAHSNISMDFDVNAFGAASNNIGGDGTGASHGGTDDILANLAFVSTTPGSENLHLTSASVAIDAGTDLSGQLSTDIDFETRPSDWDVGADEFLAPPNYRSIGTAADYITGTVSAINGSPYITGSGTAWLAANRGRGDRITIDATPYTISSVTNNTFLELTAPFAGVTGSSKAFTIARKFTTLPAWINCVQNLVACPGVSSSSLVADNRSEVGIAYDDSVFTNRLFIDNSTTDANHTITLTADHGNRHYGIANGGVVLDNGADPNPAIVIADNHVAVEWIEIKNGIGNGVQLQSLAAGSRIDLRSLLIHNVPGDCVHNNDQDPVLTLQNSILYECGRGFRNQSNLSGSAFVSLLNNTVFSSNQGGAPSGFSANFGGSTMILLRNNIAHSNASGDYGVGTVNGSSSDNLASDGTGVAHSPLTGGVDNVLLGLMNFVSTAGGSEDLHITSGSAAQGIGSNLSSLFNYDVDGGTRFAGVWDVGADDIQATTEVELVSFEAHGGDSTVVLTWETASELDNLGFHLYRATSDGTWTRLTQTPIPGLGSSPVGQAYRYADDAVDNGVTYRYELEDIDANGILTRHGPVFATPGESTDDSEDVDAPSEPTLVRFGEPENNHLRVVRSNRRGAVVELVTKGFYAEPLADGRYRIRVPEFHSQQGVESLPVRRRWIDAVPGRGAEVVSVKTGKSSFHRLEPAEPGVFDLVATRSGTVELAERRRMRRRERGRHRTSVRSELARIVELGYQRDVKKAQLELSPFRFNEDTRELELIERVVARISFRKRDRAETRRRRPGRTRRAPLARLATDVPGLYRVSFESLFGRRRMTIATDRLALRRLGEPVRFFVEPDGRRFTRGSTLYFLSPGGDANPYGGEVVFELSLDRGGELMPLVDAPPASDVTRTVRRTAVREENHLYQAGLVEAEDPWLWDFLLGPAARDYHFEVTGLTSSPEPPVLTIALQGGSDLVATPDHHVRVFVNGTFVGETSWDAKKPRTLRIQLPHGVLIDGSNTLTIENPGDTDAAYSAVLLDRFTVGYPAMAGAAPDGIDRFRAESSQSIEVELGAGAIRLFDVTDGAATRLRAEPVRAGNVRFSAGFDRSYLAVADEAIRTPSFRRARALRWRRSSAQADFIAIGPREFLRAARPLLELRRRQGLGVVAVPIDEIFDEFGFGEPRPEAIRAFIAHAFHQWRAPAPRYVLLVGDGSYDFKNYLGQDAENHVPPMLTRTSYLHTASDPLFGAVHGDDQLPDVAVGRLPADSVADVHAVVAKIVAYEHGTAGIGGRMVVVTDNADAGGNFRESADALSELLPPGAITRLDLEELGVASTQQAIRTAFDDGASLLSYFGHGGIHVWASETLFNSAAVASLEPQSQQPIVLTMNCLNGFFHFPYFDALSEELVNAPERGAIAAFSPSGLSLHEPADVLHHALVREIASGRHARLGDALMRAQSDYSLTGEMAELLTIFHLFGDPALTLK